MNSKTIYSHGKLLLTAEYVVLDGALALALPTKYGQSLIVESIDEPKLIWKSVDYKGSIWFETIFNIQDNEALNLIKDKNNTEVNQSVLNDISISERLIQILNAAKNINPKFLNGNSGFKVTSTLGFPENWGLGSSSTLINNIANWAYVDAFKLLENTFGGSGYDIACAKNDSAITYQTNQKPLDCSQGGNKPKRIINKIYFKPKFKEHLYFVHLNKKQNSREGIAHYKSNTENLEAEIFEVTKITKKMTACNTLSEFENLINGHEQIISKIIKQKPIKELLFNDFKGSIKSLGAWGGDFILVASKQNPTSYFKQKGFNTVITYSDMVL